jgi:hypothetical protein
MSVTSTPMRAPTGLTAPDRADLRSRLLSAQFWVGIALAPIAALLLIFGGTAAAAVLAIIAVVVLALSVIMRGNHWADSVSTNVVAVNELAALREDVRADITTAARATHRALTAKVTALEQSIEAMQREIDAARSVAIEARDADNRPEIRRSSPMPSLVPSPRRPVTAVGSVPGVVRHTETVVTHSMYVDQADRRTEPGVYGSAGARSVVTGPEDGRASGSATVRPPAVEAAVFGPVEYGSRRPTPARDGAEGDIRWAADDDRADHPATRRASRAPASVPTAEDPESQWAKDFGAPDVRGIAADRHESWSDQRLRPYVTGRGDSPSGDIALDARWSHRRDGDRWAEMRADDRGRELRMAERHEERRVDETGTQLRIVDRWSSVREERIDTHPVAGGGETRAERRRRRESAGTDWSDAGWVERPASARAGEPYDDIGAPPSSDDSGWRDVRSGVVEQGRPPRSRRPSSDRGRHYVHPDGPRSDPRGRRDGAGADDSGDALDVGRYVGPDGGHADQHDATGVYRQRTDEDRYRPGTDRETHGHERPDDRDDHWVREPGRRSSGRGPDVDFQVTDDRWR